RPAAGRLPRWHLDEGRSLELGREHQETPARAARVPAHLPVRRRHMRLMVLLLSLLLAAAAGAQPATPAPAENVKNQQERAATQPGNNAPFYREVRGTQSQYTTSSAQGRETGVLIQSWGDTWRRIRNGPVMFYGGWLLVLVMAAILGLYLWKGPVKLGEALGGRQMRPFRPF